MRSDARALRGEICPERSVEARGHEVEGEDEEAGEEPFHQGLAALPLCGCRRSVDAVQELGSRDRGNPRRPTTIGRAKERSPRRRRYAAPVIAIVGAGAAGLATAIFAARRGAEGPIVVLDGAARPGAKILVSGGSRCNVTNAVVTEADFSGAPPHLVRRVLKAYGVEETVAFFREIGVALHEEEHGKLFPDANRSRVVLQALLDEAARRGVDAAGGGARAGGRAAPAAGFVLRTTRDELAARAGRAGHRRALAAEDGERRPRPAHGRGARPLGGADDAGPRAPRPRRLLSRGRCPAWRTRSSSAVRAAGPTIARRTGSLLWTHFGVSGPVVLDVSRPGCARGSRASSATVEVNLLPGARLRGGGR